MKTTILMRMVSHCKSRRHYRLLSGKFQKSITGLSSELYESAMRTFRRAAPVNLPY